MGTFKRTKSKIGCHCNDIKNNNIYIGLSKMKKNEKRIVGSSIHSLWQWIYQVDVRWCGWMDFKTKKY